MAPSPSPAASLDVSCSIGTGRKKKESEDRDSYRRKQTEMFAVRMHEERTTQTSSEELYICACCMLVGKPRTAWFVWSN